MQNVREYLAVSRAADDAYSEALKSGAEPINPYHACSEAFAMWDTRMFDLVTTVDELGQETFERIVGDAAELGKASEVG
ncbi:hypothetical protein [Caballeronia sp. LjRoot31]|uniref:hypothetical protein n=1 Tax=Caballeronia sp. LjRoot31 TaxID=3342324 RepID=UPI003ED0C7E4